MDLFDRTSNGKYSRVSYPDRGVIPFYTSQHLNTQYYDDHVLNLLMSATTQAKWFEFVKLFVPSENPRFCALFSGPGRPCLDPSILNFSNIVPCSSNLLFNKSMSAYLL